MTRKRRLGCKWSFYIFIFVAAANFLQKRKRRNVGEWGEAAGGGGGGEPAAWGCEIDKKAKDRVQVVIFFFLTYCLKFPLEVKKAGR